MPALASEFEGVFNYDEVYCPRCNFDKDTGAPNFEGRLRNPCDPGCCAVLRCEDCGTCYSLTPLAPEEAAKYECPSDKEALGERKTGETS